MLHGNIFPESAEDKVNTVDACLGFSVFVNHLGKSIKETCIFLVRYVSSLSLIASVSTVDLQASSEKISLHQTLPLRRLIKRLRGFRPILQQISGLMPKISFLIDLLEIFVNFASAWVHRDLKLLISLTHPVINSLKSTKSLIESREDDMMWFQIRKNKNVEEREIEIEHEEWESKSCIISEDEQWQIIGVSLWRKVSSFFDKELTLLISKIPDDDVISVIFPDSIMSSLDLICSSLARHLRSFLLRKMDLGHTVSTLSWLQEYKDSRKNSPSGGSSKEISRLKLTEDVDEKSLLKMLWIMSTDPEEILASFSDEEMNLLFDYQKQNVKWYDFKGNNDEKGQRGRLSRSKDGSFFHNPREVHKRNGELLEVFFFSYKNSVEY